LNPPDPDLEEKLAKLEPPYKSRGEAQVGRFLDRYGIPFLYEHPLLIWDRGKYRTWHPDFTLPTYDGLILEYAGMPEIDDYMTGIRHKQRAYEANGIPALFLYPNDLEGPDWPSELYEKLAKVQHKSVSSVVQDYVK
jgi:hypothetical protein